MDDGRQVGVAIVEDVGAGGVQEGRTQGVDPLGPPDDRRLLAAGELGERLERELDRLGAAARDRHGEEIQQRPLGLVARLFRDVFPSGLDHEAGEVLRDAWSWKHGFPSLPDRGPPGPHHNS